MLATVRQNFALCKRQDSPEAARQNIGVDEYLRILGENIRALMEHHGVRRETLEAIYLDGRKKGKRVSPRTIGGLAHPREGTSAPQLDVVAAIAAAFDLLPWQLLVPDLDPADPPRTQLSSAQKRARDEYEEIRKQFLGAGKRRSRT